MNTALISAQNVTVGMTVLDANQASHQVTAVTDADGLRTIELDGGASSITITSNRIDRCPVLQVVS